MRSILRTFFLALAALLSPLGVVFAQGTAPASGDEAVASIDGAPTGADTTLLWRIVGDDSERPSFLFGTIHIIPTEDYFLDANVVRALNDSDEVLFEIDPGDMQNPAVMMNMMSRINMRGDTSLQDLLPPARYDSVASYFDAMGMPMFMLGKMKPMFLSSMVGQDMSGGNPFAGAAAGEESKMKSYEFELSKLAKVGNKPVSGLETIEFQLGLFDSIPYTVQAEMLYEAVVNDLGAESTGSDNQMTQMIDMYRRRAVAEMSKLITDESADYGNFEELLVVRRNENWVPIITERLTDTPTLYAVGAGHLGGTRGVIALLRASGLTVEPVY